MALRHQLRQAVDVAVTHPLGHEPQRRGDRTAETALHQVIAQLGHQGALHGRDRIGDGLIEGEPGLDSHNQQVDCAGQQAMYRRHTGPPACAQPGVRQEEPQEQGKAQRRRTDLPLPGQREEVARRDTARQAEQQHHELEQ